MTAVCVCLFAGATMAATPKSQFERSQKWRKIIIFSFYFIFSIIYFVAGAVENGYCIWQTMRYYSNAFAFECHACIWRALMQSAIYTQFGCIAHIRSYYDVLWREYCYLMGRSNTGSSFSFLLSFGWAIASSRYILRLHILAFG